MPLKALGGIFNLCAIKFFVKKMRIVISVLKERNHSDFCKNRETPNINTETWPLLMDTK